MNFQITKEFFFIYNFTLEVYSLVYNIIILWYTALQWKSVYNKVLQ